MPAEAGSIGIASAGIFHVGVFCIISVKNINQQFSIMKKMRRSWLHGQSQFAINIEMLAPLKQI
jgi:hypothetical protein